mmetsp:Transcript_48081/g.103020  ORF Transcript_48081/g.103020 Transcript_48081/m.103020 type:complete len:101 (+) Transcript_48081:11-313(+)
MFNGPARHLPGIPKLESRCQHGRCGFKRTPKKTVGLTVAVPRSMLRFASATVAAFAAVGGILSLALESDFESKIKSRATKEIREIRQQQSGRPKFTKSTK